MVVVPSSQYVVSESTTQRTPVPLTAQQLKACYENPTARIFQDENGKYWDCNNDNVVDLDTDVVTGDQLVIHAESEAICKELLIVMPKAECLDANYQHGSAEKKWREEQQSKK